MNTIGQLAAYAGDALADRTQRWLANRRGRSEGGELPVQAQAIAQLVATSVSASSPALDRLAEIAKERIARASRRR